MGALEPVKPGDLLGGRFRVERVLGAGGMGTVVSAWHEVLHTRVALKLLRQEAPTPATIERFLREGRAAASLRGDNVARVLDVGTLPDGTPFLVMELLEGETLADVVARGPMPVSDAVDVALDVCVALSEAHRAGIVHRDIKPANLIRVVREDGSPSVKVLDFGIARTIALDLATLTEADTILGSPRYMSPEQARDPREVDGRTDVWSLGVVLYEMLTGATPFEGHTAAGVLFAIAESVPESPCKKRDGLDAQLGEIVLRMLRKDRDARFDSMESVATALAPFGGPDAQKRAEASSRAAYPRKAPSMATPATASSDAETQASTAPSGPANVAEATSDIGSATTASARGLWASSRATGPTKSSSGSRPYVLGASAVGLVALLAVGGRTLQRQSSPASSPTVPAAPVAPTASATPMASDSVAPPVASVSAATSASPASSVSHPSADKSSAPPLQGKAAPAGRSRFGSEDWGDRKLVTQHGVREQRILSKLD